MHFRHGLLKLVISDLQDRETGVFAGDEWGEVDTRFVYIGISALSLLGRLDAIDVELAVMYVLSCQNYDGGFGVVPEAESHSGQSEYYIAYLQTKLT